MELFPSEYFETFPITGTALVPVQELILRKTACCFQCNENTVSFVCDGASL
jgi:hypothetical protein